MITIVIPTYNEKKNAETFIPEILRFIQDMDAEVLIVDSNSPDGTADAIKALQQKFPGRIHLVEEPEKRGLGSAYRNGFAEALKRGSAYVVQMDADGSHDYKDIPRLLETVRSQQADMAIGSRYVEGGGVKNWSKRREMISRGGSFYARTILGSSIQDITGGFRAWTAETLRKTKFEESISDGYAFQIEMARRAEVSGAKIQEVPIIFSERREGESKFSKRIFVEAIFTPWKIVRSIRKKDVQ